MFPLRGASVSDGLTSLLRVLCPSVFRAWPDRECLSAAEEEMKGLLATVEGEQVPVLEGGFAPAEAARKLFKTGDAELKIGSVLDAAVSKGAVLHC